MGMGVGIMQPTLPSIVREWLPQRVALGTAVYSNGLLVGEALSASLTIPLLLPLVAQSWRWSLVVWAVPLVIVAAVAALLKLRSPSDEHIRDSRPAIWWPDWRSSMTWRVGLIAGAISGIYFSSNAFLPDYLRHTGRPEFTSAALASLNWGQIPASFLLLLSPTLMLHQSSLVFMSCMTLISTISLVSTPSEWSAYWCAVIGFSTAFNLIVALGLPPLLIGSPDVPRLAAGMFTISYLCAVLVPIVGGFIWDWSAVAASAFLPVAICAVIVMPLAATLPLQSSANFTRQSASSE
jgi:MFS transporter, CP family, cyanate transporter